MYAGNKKAENHVKKSLKGGRVMKELELILHLLMGGLMLLYAYMAVYAVIGCIATRKFQKAKKFHRYAIVIAARNEEMVIANLLRSIADQTYPADRITTFVAADNCTDATARIARQNGAVCYERFDEEHRTKGYALSFLFEQIRKDYGIEYFDGYLVLDADNTLKSDYIEKMNDAFDSGAKIVTSYRNTRNLKDGCIAASYAIHWLRTVRIEHRARSVLGLATRIQGTGFLFANELVKDGWKYTSLTEDRAFCADAVLKGYEITYQHEAEFYDEQPADLAIAMRQRIRWSKGHLQSFRECAPGLLCRISTAKGLRAKLSAYDMLLVVFPYDLVKFILKISIELIVFLSAFWFCGRGMGWSVVNASLAGMVSGLFFYWLRQTAMAAYVLWKERRRLEDIPTSRKILYASTFFLFDMIGTISICLAVVTKVDWKPIPHYGDRRAAASASSAHYSARPHPVFPEF